MGWGDAVTDKLGALGPFVAVARGRCVPLSGPRFQEGSLARWPLGQVWGNGAPTVVQFSVCTAAVVTRVHALTLGEEIGKAFTPDSLGAPPCSSSQMGLTLAAPQGP